jgi:hypothetical protein
MKFKFENKKEVFLIHEDSKKQGLWEEPGWDDQDCHPSSKPAWEDWEIHTPPIEPVEDDQKIPDFITNTVWEKSGNHQSNIRGSCSCAAYATKEDQEGVAQEEQDVIDRYYFSKYGRNNLNLIRYGERSCFFTLN